MLFVKAGEPLHNRYANRRLAVENFLRVMMFFSSPAGSPARQRTIPPFQRRSARAEVPARFHVVHHAPILLCQLTAPFNAVEDGAGSTDFGYFVVVPGPMLSAYWVRAVP